MQKNEGVADFNYLRRLDHMISLSWYLEEFNLMPGTPLFRVYCFIGCTDN
jgi:hypothetical protein